MTLPTIHRKNFQHLYWDVFWFGILAGTTLAFQAVYAVRIGASSLHISLLTAGPALVNLLLSLPAGRWLEGRSFGRVSFWTAVIQRLGFLVMAALPLVGGPGFQVSALISITLLMSIPGTLLAISFNSLFAEAIPAEWRAEVVGRRNALVAVSMTVSTLLAGQLLDRIPDPWNYALVFLIGAIGAYMSAFELNKIRTLAPSGLAGISLAAGGAVPTDAAAAPAAADAATEGAAPAFDRPANDLASAEQAVSGSRPALPARLVPLTVRLRLSSLTASLGLGRSQLPQEASRANLRLDILRGPFGLFMLAYLAFYAFQYVGAPLFPVFFVEELQLSNSAISLGTSLFYSVMFLVSLRLSRLTTRYGHRRLSVAGALAFSLYPLILALAFGPGLYWVASLAGGAVWAVVGAAMLNRLMERVPDGGRAAYMATHNLTLNLGILAGSLLSPLITEMVGVRSALFVSFGLRLLAGFLMLLWG